MWLFADAPPSTWIVALVIGLPGAAAAVYATWQASKADRNKVGNQGAEAVLLANQQLIGDLQKQQQYERGERIASDVRQRAELDEANKQLNAQRVRADHAARAKANAEAEAERCRRELATALRTIEILRDQATGT